MLLPRRNIAAIRPYHLANKSAKRVAGASPAAQKASARGGFTMRPKTGNASAAPPEAQPSSWQRASAKATSPGQATLTAPSSSSPSHRHWYLQYSRTLHLPLRLRALTVLEDGRGTCLGKREKETGKEPTKDPLARRGRAGVGGRPTRDPGAGLLQLYSPTSYLPLRFSSPTPSCSSPALRSELCQPTLYWAFWRLPMPAHPPP